MSVDSQINLNLDLLLKEELLLNDDTMKAVENLNNGKQKLKSLQVKIELHSSSLINMINRKGDLLQQQWQIVSKQEQKSSERSKEKIQLLIMQDQQQILTENLKNKRIIQENIDGKRCDEHVSNELNETILKRKKYEKQLYELKEEIGRKEEKLKIFFNNFNKWALEK